MSLQSHGALSFLMTKNELHHLKVMTILNHIKVGSAPHNPIRKIEMEIFSSRGLASQLKIKMRPDKPTEINHRHNKVAVLYCRVGLPKNLIFVREC